MWGRSVSGWRFDRPPVVSALSGLPRRTHWTLTNSQRERHCATAQYCSRPTSLRETLRSPFLCTHLDPTARDAATALLAGDWTGAGMRARLLQVFELSRSPRWIDPLVARVLARFGLHPPTPRHAVLTSFLAADRKFCRAIERLVAKAQRQEPLEQFQSTLVTNVLGLPRPEMAPAPAIVGTDELPVLVTAGELADWLGITISQLDWFAGCRRYGRSSSRRQTGALPLLLDCQVRWKKAVGGKPQAAAEGDSAADSRRNSGRHSSASVRARVPFATFDNYLCRASCRAARRPADRLCETFFREFGNRGFTRVSYARLSRRSRAVAGGALHERS